jgi:uncharacterized membrane protein
MWALLGIGASHLVVAPTLGATVGLFAIWVFVVVYAVKYGAWELGIRYSYATGENPIAAYSRLPGPNNWAVWLTLGLFALGYTMVTAAVGASTAAFVAALTGLSSEVSFVLLMTTAAGFVFISQYSRIENVLLAFMSATGVLVVLGAVVGLPAIPNVAETILPSIGAVSDPAVLALVVAVAGSAPTSLSTSIVLGSWATAKSQGAAELTARGLDPTDETYHEYLRSWIATGKRDFHIGYLFSLTLAVAMITVAATALYPTPPTDETFAFVIGSVVETSLGPWSYWLMIIGAFAALFSTVITLMDGVSRAVADIVPHVSKQSVNGDRLRRGVIAGQLLAGLSLTLLIGVNPVSLIVAVIVVIAILEVYIYPANWYVVETTLPEPLRPSAGWRLYYALSLTVVVGFALVAAAVQFDLLG